MWLWKVTSIRMARGKFWKHVLSGKKAVNNVLSICHRCIAQKASKGYYIGSSKMKIVEFSVCVTTVWEQDETERCLCDMLNGANMSRGSQTNQNTVSSATLTVTLRHIVVSNENPNLRITTTLCDDTN